MPSTPRKAAKSAGLSILDVMKREKVCRRTVYEWVYTGKIPAAKTVDGIWRVDPKYKRPDSTRGPKPTALTAKPAKKAPKKATAKKAVKKAVPKKAAKKTTKKKT